MQIYVEKNNIKLVLYTLIICSLVFSIFFISVAAYEKNINQSAYYTSINGTIESIEIDEEDETLLIKLKEYNNIFTSDLEKEKVENFHKNIKINDYLELTVSEKRIDKKKTPIIKASLENKEILNLEEDMIKTVNGLFLAFIIACCIAAILIIVLIIIKRQERKNYVDYYEHFLPIMSYDFINKKNYSVEQLEKRNNIVVISYIGCIFLLMILIIIFGNLFPDYPHIIIPIVVAIFSLATYLLFKYIKGYKSTKADVKLFVEMYMKYLNKDEGINGEIVMFTSDSLIIGDYYLDDDDDELRTEISYETLDFYVACVYKNNFHHAHIYICSDYMLTSYPICFKLDSYIYKEILKNNIKVKNLDYLLNNLEEEININKPKFGAKVVKYKD